MKDESRKGGTKATHESRNVRLEVLDGGDEIERRDEGGKRDENEVVKSCEWKADMPAICL